MDPITVLLITSLGDIKLELYPDKAPATVENFVRYAEEDFYDNTIFHRVIAGFMVQGGGYTPSLKKKPTHAPIKNEANNGLSNTTGTIAMARTMVPDSATSQFFINVADNTPLDYSAPTSRGWGYAVFGKVIDGMDVVYEIAATPTEIRGHMADVPQNPVLIRDVKILGKAPVSP